MGVQFWVTGCVVLFFIVQLTIQTKLIRPDFGAEGIFTTDIWRSPGTASRLALGRGSQAEGDGGFESLHFQAAGVGHYPFVLLSAYRENPTTFHAIGLSSRLVRDHDKLVLGCEWHPGNKTTPDSNSSTLLADGEPHYGNTEPMKMPYVEVVLTCEFAQKVGLDGLGGRLYVTVQSTKHVDVAPIVALQETASYDFQATVNKPRPYKYAFCGPPISGNIRPQVIKEWLIYHLFIYEAPKVHFFFYNAGGLTGEGRDLLEPFVNAGFVTILDVSEHFLYPAWWTSQIVFINDCLHRTRYLTDWTLFHDFDEFIYTPPPNKFSDLLQTNARAHVLTFGSWPVNISVCRPPETPRMWAVERMLWRGQRPYCRTKHKPYMCPGAAGRRKYAVNPRKEVWAAVHKTLGKSSQHVVHFNASVIRVEHFQGLLSQSREVCTVTRKPTTMEVDNGLDQGWIEQEPPIIPVIRQAKRYVAELQIAELHDEMM